MPLINATSMYSAGFTAQTLGIRVSRHLAVAVNRRDLTGPRRCRDAGRDLLHGLVHRVAAWALGLGSGLLFSTSGWFTGPLASNNPVGEYGLGRVATIAVSFLLYVVPPKPAVAPAAQPAKGSATMAV
jgi:purine-cytosine permease-like protein